MYIFTVQIESFYRKVEHRYRQSTGYSVSTAVSSRLRYSDIDAS
jgi:hypothetical protein